MITYTNWLYMYIKQDHHFPANDKGLLTIQTCDCYDHYVIKIKLYLQREY